MSLQIQSAKDGNLVLTVSEASNPAVLYLASLSSAESRRVTLSRMNRFAALLQLPNWQHIPWRELDRSWLLLAKEGLANEQRSPDTVNAIISMLKGVALQAWELQLITDHCFMRIKNTKGLRGARIPKRRWLSVDEMRTLLDRCLLDERKQGLRDAALIALLYGCGLRRSEVVAIDMSQIDMQERSIRVIGKGNKERIVYPPTRAWHRLTDWLEEAEIKNGPVFCRIRKGGHVLLESITHQSVYFIVKRWSVLTGISSFTPHDLRGSFISYLLDNGEDIKTVADIVGHNDIRTTAGYDRRGEQRKMSANRSIEI